MTGKQRPRLMDVQVSPLRFQPGDRLLVKVFHAITKEERKRIQHVVEKWAGSHIEVLVIDSTRVEIKYERGIDSLSEGV